VHDEQLAADRIEDDVGPFVGQLLILSLSDPGCITERGAMLLAIWSF